MFVGLVRRKVVVVLLIVAYVALPVPAALAAGRDGAGAGFDAAMYGRPLSDEEMGELSGEWWQVAMGAALGAADGVVSYATSRRPELRSSRYWAGLAAAGLVGAGMGALGGATDTALKGAKAGVRIGFGIYSWARSRLVGRVAQRALADFKT